MNAPKVTAHDYINFVIAAQRVFSTIEASRVSPEHLREPAHDAYTHLLQRMPPDNEALWDEVAPLVKRDQGILIIDDTTLISPTPAIELVSRHWSGKHRRIVQGISIESLVWTDGEMRLPIDFCIYAKEQDGLSKNDHFRHMIQRAHTRGFAPQLVAFDSWYGSLDNLKLLRDLGWSWVTQLKRNRQVSIDRSGTRAIANIYIPVNGLMVHLKGYRWIKVFRKVSTNGGA